MLLKKSLKDLIGLTYQEAMFNKKIRDAESQWEYNQKFDIQKKKKLGFKNCMCHTEGLLRALY